MEPEIFDTLAAHPTTGVLPVRCFRLRGFPKIENGKLPVATVEIPSTLLNAVAPYFEISSASIYSVHGAVQGARDDIIGDIFINLVRR